MCLKRRLTRLPVLVLLATSCVAIAATHGDDAAADEPEPDFSAELPRIPPVEPQKALATFQVQPGFRLEQVAAEPLVADPVAVSFDEDGRLYVVEMRGYSEQADERLSEVRLLTDTDGDGHFDTHSVFVDQLAWPTAVICYDGGVFIADAPDILYCKDTDGDGRADTRK
ncbi:MAG TPA: cytochrome C, partial [Pirellulales bacterium]|nr:cytochrome C [Pirellulales bacterium]